LLNPMMDTIVTNLWEGPYTIRSYFLIDYKVTYQNMQSTNIF